jgi:hypothetical protein
MAHCGQTNVGLALYKHAPDINICINITSKDPTRLCQPFANTSLVGTKDLK